MKYVLINIKNFIKQETTIFCLVVLCIFSSVIIINFAFGFYHHLQQKKLDGEIKMRDLSINFTDADRSHVTKGGLMELLLQLDNETLKDCTINLEGKYADDWSGDPAIDNGGLVEYVQFCIKDGVVTVAPIEESIKDNGILKEGNYFTKEQVEKGELVCLAPFYSSEQIGDEEQAKWAKKYDANSDGTYTVDGKTYTSIGKVDFFSFLPIIPVTTMADDCYIKCMLFEYNHVLKRKDYIEITNAVEEAYGDYADIPKLDIPEVDSLKFYNSLLALCLLLIIMSGIVLCLLYEYVLLQRAGQLTVYRLCGLTRGKAKLLYFMECFVLSVVVYILAVVCFHFFLLPYLSRMFEYIKASCTPYSYGMLGILYLILSSVLLYFMICRKLSYNVASGLKEG